MHTEDEARQKWCPFARVPPYEGSGSPANRWNEVSVKHPDSSYKVQCACIASECMAWRVVEMVYTDPPNERASDKGYCGLAGKP